MNISIILHTYTYNYISYLHNSSYPSISERDPAVERIHQAGSTSLRVGVDLSEADPCATYLPLLGEANPVGVLVWGGDFGKFRKQNLSKNLENLGDLIFFKEDFMSGFYF